MPEPKGESWKKNFNLRQHEKPVSQQMYRDLEARRQVGLKKYGPDFKGDPLQQAYEEALDLAFYLKVQLLRRDGIDETL